MVRSLIQHITTVCKDERRLQCSVARVLGVIGFAGFMTMGAHMHFAIPGIAAPFTMQTFFALVVGAFLGPLDGALAMMLYLGVGATGMPVFASTDQALGLSYFSGVTGGYLIGFLAATVLVGFAVEYTHNFYAHMAAFACGAAVILGLGALQMGFVLHMTPYGAIMAGVVPFIPGDVLKAGLALTAFMALRSYKHRVCWNLPKLPKLRK